MASKLLYALPDDNPKHTGCMNGILQHFLSVRSINTHNHHHKRLPTGQSKMGAEDPRKEMKEKSLNDHKKTSRMSAKSSMASLCSSASSTLPSVEYHRRAQEGQPFFGESPAKDLGNDQPKSSINSHQLLIRSLRKQQVTNNAMKHIDSPRPSQPSNLQHQRVSTSSNNTSRSEHLSLVKDKKIGGHARRMSFDGRESGESIKSSLKLNELPRLSLDSRQGAIRSASVLDSGCFQQEELGSSRPISSVIAKLMGLEDTLQSKPSIKAQQTRSRRDEDVDFLSKSARSLDESDTDSDRVSISVYKEIDKRLAELDFGRSGKDLRALKHILEAMQRTKSKLETTCKEKRASVKTSTMSMKNGGSSNDNRNLRDCNLTNWKSSKDRSSKVTDKGIAKPGKVMRSANKLASCAFQHQKSSNLPPVKTGQSTNAKSDSTEKRRAKDLSPKAKQKCSKLERFSQERRTRSGMMTSNEEPKNLTKEKTQSPNKNSEGSSKKIPPRKLDLDNQYDMIHTPHASEKLYKTVGPGLNAIEESKTILKEQQSPMSVLDAEFYGDESPSPVKKKATAFQDKDGTPLSTEPKWKAVNTNHLCNSTRTSFSFDNGYSMERPKEKLNNICIMRELSKERSQIQAKSSYPRIEHENEFRTSIFTRDLARRSESWKDFSSENSWLVFDIECLMFKDLIVELVSEEASW